MVSEIEAALWRLMWRLVFAGIIIFLRIFWLPILIIAGAYVIVVPALIAIAELLQVLVQPAAAIAVVMLVLWMWRR